MPVKKTNKNGGTDTRGGYQGKKMTAKQREEAVKKRGVVARANKMAKKRELAKPAIEGIASRFHGEALSLIEYAVEHDSKLVDIRKMLPEPFTGLDLGVKDLRFLAAYTSNGFDAYNAIAVSGHSFSSKAEAARLSSSILNRPNVHDAMQEYIAQIIAPYKDKLQVEVLDVYYRRAFYDVSTFYDEHFQLRAQNEIPKEWHCCIDGVSISKSGASYSLPDRDKALEALWRFVNGEREELDDHTHMKNGESGKRLVQLRALISDIVPADIKPKTDTVLEAREV